METQSPEVEVQVQEHQPEVQQSYKFGLDIAGVNNLGDGPPVEATTPAQTEETPAAVVETPAPVETGPTNEDLARRIHELESKPATIQYLIPEAVETFWKDPANIQPLADIKAMSLYDAMAAKIQTENPWATTKEQVHGLVMRKYPDLDLSIPETLGMDDLDYPQFAHEAVGFKNELFTKAEQELNEKYDKIKSEAIPAPAEPDYELIEKEMNSYVDGVTQSFDPKTLPLVAGIEVEPIDMAKVGEIARSGEGGYVLNPKDGKFYPDVHGIILRKHMENLVKAVQPLVESSKRTSPQAVLETVRTSLNSNVPPNEAPAGTHTFQQPVKTSGRPQFGLKIQGVSN